MANIYISSTFSDLQDYREAVYDILRKTRHDVVAMEDYVAADQRPLDKCLADVAACDVYIGIFAWRYGYIPDKDNPTGKSITELEYRKATELGKPCLVFLLSEDTPWLPKFQDISTSEGQQGKLIKALRQELGAERLASFFTSPDHLASLVGAAVGRWEAERRGAPLQALAHVHVISYSPLDAESFALELARRLEAGAPGLPVWLEQRDVPPGQNRRDQIAAASSACDSLLV